MNKTINSKEIAYSVGKNDECYTLDYGVAPILEFIPKGAIVWCPFDDETSEFVKQIRKNNQVIFSNIQSGQPFLEFEPSEHWDVIVSNPPFTNKRAYFERALSFGKPFALIMTNTWLNDSAPKQLFAERDLQLLMFDKRMLFMNNGVIQKKITFSSSYFCCDFLPKQIVMRTLNKK